MLGLRGGSRAAADDGRHESKFLLDQNLSPRLCEQLADLGAAIVHVRASDSKRPTTRRSGLTRPGTTLLHMCVEYDELEIARWLLDQGMDVNVRAAIGRSGFGGYTPLFDTVVSLPNFWMNYRKRGPFIAPFAQLLLERGADPNVRASIWKRLGPGHDRTTTRHDYRDVTALSWGRRFHDQIFVSEPALRCIEQAGGLP